MVQELKLNRQPLRTKLHTQGLLRNLLWNYPPSELLRGLLRNLRLRQALVSFGWTASWAPGMGQALVISGSPAGRAPNLGQALVNLGRSAGREPRLGQALVSFGSPAGQATQELN